MCKCTLFSSLFLRWRVNWNRVREELVKTLGHGSVNLEQLKLFGSAMTNEELIYFEIGLLFSEEYWWEEYRRKTNYEQESN